MNYNSWSDTIECLESVLRNDYPDYQVIVVDNNSPNDSMKYIKAWADGKLDVWVKPKNPLRILSFPPVEKPIPYVYYTREEAEKGGNPELEKKLKMENKKAFLSTTYPLIFIQTGKNLGFAGGNNVAIKYVLAKDDFEYVWLLNNDTVIKKDSLLALVEKAESYGKQSKKVGIVGSKLLYYDNPAIIQGVGGLYRKRLATSKHIGVLENDVAQYDNESVLKKIDYIIGASMLINRDFINDVGLMCEEYFLYFEDLDWSLRGKLKGYDLGYCWRSRVYHKEGKSIGSSQQWAKRSRMADCYALQNRVVFTRKFFKKHLWSVYIGLVASALIRIRRGKFGTAKCILKQVIQNLLSK